VRKRKPGFFVQHYLSTEPNIFLDNTAERKGKLVEKRGRKATGLKLKRRDFRWVDDA